jgi:cytochrome P450
MVRDGSCFIPFGLGPYACAGKQLGWMKTRAMIAKLVMGFQWKLAKGRGSMNGELLGKDEFTVAFEACWVDFEKI